MDSKPRIVAHLWETPVIVRGYSWVPVTQVATYIIMFWYSQHRSPERSIHQRAILAGLTTTAILGSEWAHNLSHLITAYAIRKPMDELHIVLGMPRCIYADLDDAEVHPRQHIQRALGGPLFNAAMLPLLSRLRQQSNPGSMLRELWDAAVGMNLFLATVSLLPIPGIDGGPILKWSLVERGYSVREADEVVRQVNGALAAILGLGSALAYLMKRRFLAILLGAIASTALGIFLGLIKESEMLQSPSKRS